MFSRYFISHPKDGHASQKTNGILDFRLAAGFVNRQEHGLTSANISFQRTVLESETHVTGTLFSDNHISFVVVSDGHNIGYLKPILGSPLLIERPPDCCEGQNCPFIITYTHRVTGVKLIYNLLFTNETGDLSDVRGNVSLEESHKIPFPDLPNGSTGSISLSDDEQMICQVDYTIEQDFDGCCDGLIHRTIVCRRYNVELQKVLKGCGCTIHERYQSILKRYPVDYTKLLQYSVLRLVLSTLLMEDKSFNVHLLRRRYQKEFQCLLQESAYNTTYYNYFFNSEVSGYWRYFKD